MTIPRIIGLIFLAAALMFGAADLWHNLVPYAYGGDAVTLGRLWALLSIRSMVIVDDLIHRYLWAPIWDLGISPLLIVPAWTFFAALGVLFVAFGRPKVADR